jgi:chemotaxis protein CheD
VEISQVAVTQAPNRLLALGIGSCVVITLYDYTLKIGAMAHTMLPDSTKYGLDTSPFKFANLAIEEIISRMELSGSKKRNMVAKIVGGANMFPSLRHESLKTGEDNVFAVKEKLKKEGIVLIGEVIGGNVGRSVEFDTATGIITVNLKI